MDPTIPNVPSAPANPESPEPTAELSGKVERLEERFSPTHFRRVRTILPPEVSRSDPSYYEPTADDFLPSPPKPRSPLAQIPSFKAFKPALLGFLLFWAASFHDWRGLGRFNLAASGRSVLQNHEVWRLFTALFTHADLGHLAANTPLFLVFGWYLRAYFGPWAFPGAALVIGALSNLATIAYYPPLAELIGASGMIYGMVALWLVLYVRFEPEYTVSMRIFRSVGVSLLLLFPTSFEPEVSYFAHASGFGIGLVVGYALTFIVKPAVGPAAYAPRGPYGFNAANGNGGWPKPVLVPLPPADSGEDRFV